RRRYGDVFTVKMLRDTWVVVADPEGVRAMLTIDTAHMRSGEANYELRPMIGTRNVLLLDGDKHLQRRKLVLPPFHGERLQAYRVVMPEVARAAPHTWPRGEPFPLLPRMRQIKLDVLLRAVFGTRADEAAKLREAVSRLLDWLVGLRGMLAFNVLGAGGLPRL